MPRSITSSSYMTNLLKKFKILIKPFKQIMSLENKYKKNNTGKKNQAYKK